MSKQIKLKIIDTLSYFDIFNYPLTLEELKLFLHFENVSKNVIKKYIQEITIINKKHGYYFLLGKESNVVKRKILKKDNRKKLGLAIRHSSLLSHIPGVKFIALTGSVAMNSGSVGDDIDLFIITKKNTLWLTRFLVVLVTKLLGKKREYKSKNTSNKFCLNMFVEEDNLEFLERNIYIAHEIVQMKVLFDKADIYKSLITRNSWIKEYFPGIQVKKAKIHNKKGTTSSHFIEKLFKTINFCGFLLQYAYMNNKITSEKIGLNKAFFHPDKKDKLILNEYKKRRDFYLNMYEKINKNANFEPNDLYIKKLKTTN